MSAVEARDVFRVYSTPEGDAAALQGLTLTVTEGEVLAVLGPSGAGKTSLLRILAGADRPSAGDVRVFDADVPKLGARALARYRASTIGYVEQHTTAALDPEVPILDSVATRLRLDGEPRARAHARELLKAVGLGSRLDALPEQLSGGERQRAAVCAALAHSPRLLLADEPTGELDRDAADTVFELVRELAHGNGTTAIVVSHDPRAGEFADRAIRIRDGRVSEEWRGQSEQIVVGRGGWIRLPEELLRSAGVRDRAEASLADGRIVVEAAPGLPEVTTPALAPKALEAAMGGERERILELRGLSKRYGDRIVLGGLRADVDRRTLTAVTGPSGSGKTTLLDLIVGLERPDSGSIRLRGQELVALDRQRWAQVRREHIGYVPQQPALTPFLSARENVELALRLRGRSDGALEALAAVGLAERAEQPVGRLSVGERLRVAIARALAARPTILVADEPTSRLDEANARAVAALFARLAREWGAAVIVASHDALVIEQADEEIRLG
jgi:ABC-type lipoprotein export system ATPase subunit